MFARGDGHDGGDHRRLVNIKMLHDHRFPNESKQYRVMRDKLLREEIKARRALESAAALRRRLPLSGRIKTDYVFEEMVKGKIKRTKLSELFKRGKNTLIIYNWMFPNEDGVSCPSCTSILDGLNGSSPHVNSKVNFVVVCKMSTKKADQWKKQRGWDKLRILSSEKNRFKNDYFAEGEKGAQFPLLTVFRRTPKGIYHFWSSEMFFVKGDPGQDPRHVDFIWPIWSLFDVTPEGRGKWHPEYFYE